MKSALDALIAKFTDIGTRFIQRERHRTKNIDPALEMRSLAPSGNKLIGKWVDDSGNGIGWRVGQIHGGGSPDLNGLVVVTTHSGRIQPDDPASCRKLEVAEGGRGESNVSDKVEIAPHRSAAKARGKQLEN